MMKFNRSYFTIGQVVNAWTFQYLGTILGTLYTLIIIGPFGAQAPSDHMVQALAVPPTSLPRCATLMAKTSETDEQVSSAWTLQHSKEIQFLSTALKRCLNY